MPDPKEMLNPDYVVDFKSVTKADALSILVEAMSASPRIKSRPAFLNGIMEREKTMSTGMGDGIALPHAKIADVSDFVIGIGRSQSGVEFDSLDGKPAHIIVMIGCHESQSGEYMRVLSKLARALKESTFREKVLAAPDAQSVVDLFMVALT